MKKFYADPEAELIKIDESVATGMASGGEGGEIGSGPANPATDDYD